MKKYISLSIIIAFIHIVYCESTSSKISEEYLYRGYTHQKLNHPDSARYFYQRIIDADENMYTTADAYLHLSEIEEACGNYKEALRLLHTPITAATIPKAGRPSAIFWMEWAGTIAS